MQIELYFVQIELATTTSVQIIVGDLFTVVSIDFKFNDLADVFVTLLDSFDVL